MSKALDIAENLALLSTKYTSSTSTLDSVVLGSSTTDHASRELTGTFNGTLGSSATFPSGHIIQISDLATTSTAVTVYNSWTAIGLSQSIIPSSSSSKILIQCQISMQQYRAGYETFGGIKLLRGSTDIFMGTMYESVMEAGLSNGSRTFLSSMNPVLYVDTEHTAGSTNTYSIQGYSGAGQCTYQTNNTLSSMLLMEIQT